MSAKQLYDARKRAQASPQVIFHRCNFAFHAGERAKRMGWQRIPLSVDDPLADEFFYDGYHGKTWQEAAHRLMPAKVKTEDGKLKPIGKQLLENLKPTTA